MSLTTNCSFITLDTVYSHCKPKLGVVFCHGHVHKALPVEYQFADTDWIFVDENKAYQPDLTINAKDNKILEFITPGTVDYVLPFNCPFTLDFKKSEEYNKSEYFQSDFFITGSQLLKFGGLFLWYNALHYLGGKLFNYIHWFDPETQEELKYMKKDHKFLSDLYLQGNRPVMDVVHRQLNSIQVRYGFSSYVVKAPTVEFIK